MALQMAASVFLSILWMIFFGDELLNMRDSSQVHFLPLFTKPKSFLALFVGGVAALYGVAWRRRRRQGKCTAVLLKLSKRGLRIVLQAIHLANLCSLANKMDKLLLLLLLLLNSKKSDFHHYATRFFIETWLTEHILVSSLQLRYFQLFQAGRVTELSGGGKEFEEMDC